MIGWKEAKRRGLGLPRAIVLWIGAAVAIWAAILWLLLA